MKNKFTLGFSPCPNDCFIFDALLHGKIDTEGLEFDPVIEDVEALNKRAAGIRKTQLDVTKLSFFSYAKVLKKYTLLDSGAALGYGVGPLVVSTSKHENNNPSSCNVAIPGINTTANLLFSLAYPHFKNKKEMLFSEIEEAVLNKEAGWGVIIHESRFTYQQKGLHKIIDLGEWWTEKYKCPIPLGGIAIKKSFSGSTKNKINKLIRRSVEYALKNPGSSKNFVRQHASEMKTEVIKTHISLYVNNFSVSLGKEGRRAVRIFLKEAEKIK